jgi:hypothetical protein
VNKQTDNHNCGTCGTTCAAGQVCSNGTCTVSCQSGETNCGGTCVNEQTDNSHCGSCSNVCGAGQSCSSGICSTTCGANLSNCAGTCRDTRDDPNNCGGCGVVCSLANSSAYCLNSTCGVAACNSGFGNCDGNSGNGCETNLQSDNNNCGSCGHVCGASTPFCSGGSCIAPKTVFVTSQTYNGAMGGLAGADSLCQARATAAGLSGTYKAWLSDTTGSPSTRFTQSTAPYVLINGTVVANNWAGLTSGTLLHAINLTETGGAPPAPSPNIFPSEDNVWSGTNANGTFDTNQASCQNWTSTSSNGGDSMGEGSATATNSTWSESHDWYGSPCPWTLALFCFQQ